MKGYGKECILGPLFKLLEATFELLIPLVVASIVDKGIGNGDSGIAGTRLEEISEEARAEFEAADLILSKGMGNYETLRKCGANVYYLFLCKCRMFADMFKVEPLTGILINDKNLED